jgi:hypothetical protein
VEEEVMVEKVVVGGVMEGKGEVKEVLVGEGVDWHN